MMIIEKQTKKHKQGHVSCGDTDKGKCFAIIEISLVKTSIIRYADRNKHCFAERSILRKSGDNAIMSEISVETGKRIRHFRISRGMTLEDLGASVYKSKATISKYEKGEIVLDLETLYAIAEALHIHVDQLLGNTFSERAANEHEVDPAFFRGVNRIYAYYFDGRVQKISKSICDILSKTDVNQYKMIMYMNFMDTDRYQLCENTYSGYLRHFDALSIIEVVHQTNPMEHGSVQILATFMDADEKWGLWNGISSRPLMPVAAKMLFTKKPLKEDAALADRLKISKDDKRLMKMYNFFAVT